MKDYSNCFKYSPEKLKKVKRYIITFSILPVALGGIISLLILITNLRTFIYTEYLAALLIPICVAVAVQSTIVFLVIYKIDGRILRHRHHTFLHIGRHQFIYSRYTGELVFFGKRYVFKTLEIANFSDVKSIDLDFKTQNVHITLLNDSGREYEENSENLRYYFKRDKLIFHFWWCNECGFKKKNEIIVKNLFLQQKQIYESLIEAKDRFDTIPKPKPYRHKELEYVKRRKALMRFKDSL